MKHHDPYPNTLLGFWLYLMSDGVLFATLFVTYLVLKGSTFGGPGPKELLDPTNALAETVVLLTSSFLCAPAMHAAFRNQKHLVLLLLSLLFLFGATFLYLGGHELIHLVETGNSWQKSAFLSAFFGLIGTHQLHIVFGGIWLILLMTEILISGLTPTVLRRLTCFRLFWHFSVVVWLFVFTIVYLMGAR
jgi:cytochrome o ubiquinol oxidase subunit 3